MDYPTPPFDLHLEHFEGPGGPGVCLPRATVVVEVLSSTVSLTVESSRQGDSVSETS